MKPTVTLLNWKKIFLDTSVIIDYMRDSDVKDPIVNKRINFTKQLIDFLVDNKTEDGTERVFQISSITISEIRTLKVEDDIFREIIYALNASDVEIIPFDRKVALYINKEMRHYLDKKNLNNKIKGYDFLAGNYSSAREWLIKDYLIAASAKYHNADVVLSGDINTFKPICEEFNVPFADTYPDSYNYNSKYIFYQI